MDKVDTMDPNTGELREAAVVGLRGRVRLMVEEYGEKLRRKRQLPTGEEIPDERPMQPPIGYRRQPTMVEHIRAMVRSEQLRLEAEAAGAETFEEADDFDIADELEPVSAYEFEEIFEPVRPAEPDRAEPKLGEAPGPNGSEPPTGAGSASAGSAAPVVTDAQ